MPPELISYIQQARSQGQSDEQIRQALINVGWTSEQIGQVLGAAALGPQLQTQAPAQINTYQPQVGTTTEATNPAIAASEMSAAAKPKPAKRLPKLPLILGGGAVLILVLALIVAVATNKKSTGVTNYQVAIQDFINDVHNKNQAAADSLESPAFKSLIAKSDKGNTSFTKVCDQEGVICTNFFQRNYLSNATNVYKSYTASDGVKGKQIVFSQTKSAASTSDCSGSSTTTLSVAAVPSGQNWLIDNVSINSSSSGSTCTSTGSFISAGQ